MVWRLNLDVYNPYSAEIFLYKPWRPKGFSIWNHHKCLSYLFPVHFNPLTAKWFNWNFHPLEVVSRWRDPQLQVSENYSDLMKWSQLFSNRAEAVLNVVIIEWKPEYIRHRRLKG